MSDPKDEFLKLRRENKATTEKYLAEHPNEPTDPAQTIDERINADTLGGLTLEEILHRARMMSGGGPNVTDILFNEDTFYWQWLAESKDGFSVEASGAGTVTLDGSGANISTAALVDDFVFLHKEPIDTYHHIPFTWDRSQRFKFNGWIPWDTNQIGYITIGLAAEGSEASSHFGFKIVNAGIFGSVGNEVTETLTDQLETIVEDAGNPEKEFWSLEARLFPNERVDFYINDTYKGSINTGLPSGYTGAGYIIWLAIQAKANSVRTIICSLWKFLQTV